MAWSKIEADTNNLSHEQMRKIVDEISYGLGLDHPHIIKVSTHQQLDGPAAAASAAAAAALFKDKTSRIWL